MMALALIPASIMPLWLWAVSRLMPLTYAVSLLRGIAAGEAWAAHALDVGVLAAMFAVWTAVSVRVFRWQ
jgi:ABC-type multidrug transport system permease subunit